MSRLLILAAGIVAVVVGIAFVDILPTAPLIALAIFFWAVYLTILRAERKSR